MTACLMEHRRRPCQQGFSLIEVVIALGLLAMVLISVSAMFSEGRHEVQSGRTASEALALSRSILEEMKGWAFHQTYSMYGLDGTATTYTVDTRTNTFAGQWQPILDEKLVDGYASIRILSVATGGSTPVLASSKAIRVIVTVRWNEGPRSRMIELGVVKV